MREFGPDKGKGVKKVPKGWKLWEIPKNPIKSGIFVICDENRFVNKVTVANDF